MVEYCSANAEAMGLESLWNLENVRAQFKIAYIAITTTMSYLD